MPVTEEIERGETSLLIQAIPLLEHGRPTGAMILVRDVTDLRRRDRALMSKDATIREIHHRVKNNLQTIAALLRLQGRRLQSEEAQEAIQESERRIRSIAIVHETLSREAADVVNFSDIVGPLVRVVEDTVSTPELRLHFDVEGDAGELPGEVVTPLAVVLNELMQNAVDHAFPINEDGAAEGHVRVWLRRGEGELAVDVVDDGVGLPAGFSLDRSRGLGLSIVHALVTSELGGSIEIPETWSRAQDPSLRVVPVKPAVRSLPKEGLPLPAKSAGGALAGHPWSLTGPLLSSRVGMPPQMPASWFVANANSRHSSLTKHASAGSDGWSHSDLLDAGNPWFRWKKGNQKEDLARVITWIAHPPGLGVPVVRPDPGERHCCFLAVFGLAAVGCRAAGPWLRRARPRGHDPRGASERRSV